MEKVIGGSSKRVWRRRLDHMSQNKSSTWSKLSDNAQLKIAKESPTRQIHTREDLIGN